MTDERGHRWYLTAFGIGVCLVAVVNTVSTFPFAVAATRPGLPLNLLCLAVFLAATGASALRIVRGTQWRVLAAVWIAAVLGASALLRSALPADQIASLPDWSPSPLGFVALAVLLGQRVIFMVVHADRQRADRLGLPDQRRPARRGHADPFRVQRGGHLGLPDRRRTVLPPAGTGGHRGRA